jgi:hypothetical protein
VLATSKCSSNKNKKNSTFCKGAIGQYAYKIKYKKQFSVPPK